MTTAIKRNILPQNVKPHHYDLHIIPQLENKTFEGVVSISFEADDATELVLNCVDIKFTQVSVAGPSGVESIDPAAVKLDTTNETATITTANRLKGAGTLTLNFTGIIGDRLQGFYSSTLASKDTLGVTQFESVDARRAFPCWDEPARKATFKLTLTVRSDVQVWSNTDVERFGPSADREGCTTTVFQRTPIMSTYLVAWLVGRMESIERIIDKTHGGQTRVRILTPRGMIQKASFALDVACKVLPLYEKLFGSDYILSKVDLAAIPDFAAGAMENWGLITFRETALLCDDSSSALHRRWVALVVAHELAHQWFGNLVTMDWWKELWLNESFATWIEYWAVDQLFPEWDIMTHFVTDETTRALSLDALRSSHPIEVDLCNAREIDSIFDAISYSKGANLLRMIVDFIGQEAFASGISKYLHHFQFANATTVQLWEFLGAAANKDLASMLRAWTGEQGYPVLMVQQSGGKIVVEQRRFLETGDVRPEEDKTVWQVPITILHSDGQKKTEILKERTDTFVTRSCSWVKVNHNITAFCRVCYSKEMLERLFIALGNGELTSPADRLGLISDYHAFARANVASVTEALKFMLRCDAESHTEVWSAVLALASDVNSIVTSTASEVLPLWWAFTLDVCLPALERIHYTPQEGENSKVSQLRASLLARASASGDARATDVLLRLFENRTAAPIHSDLRAAVYAAYVRERGREGFTAMKKLATETDDAMERARSLRALCASKEPALTREALNLILDGSVRPQDSVYIVMAASTNPSASDEYVSFVTTHFNALEERLPGMLLSRVLKSFDQLWKPSVAYKVEAWWATTSEGTKSANTRTFEQGLEGLRSNASWAARDSPKVVRFLQGRKMLHDL